MLFTRSLKQPFPLDTSLRSKVVMAVFFGVFIFTFLLIFQPFELDQFSSSRLLLISLSYGLITFGCVLFATIVTPLMLPEVFNEKSWTTGKQIIVTAYNIFLIGLVNFIASPLLVDTPLKFSTAIWFQGITLAIGIIPVSIFILLRQNQLLKKFSHEAAVIEQKLQEREPITAGGKGVSTKISFTGDYQNDHIELYTDDLYFITSAGNYIKFFHLEKEKLVYSMIRSSLRKAEEAIVSYPHFYKCHRAYIINLDKISHVEGNAQGYKVRFDGYEDYIPVSRNVSTEFSDKLLAFRKK